STGRNRHDLPWEISHPVRANRTPALATGREGAAEVSRGRSNPLVPPGGRPRGGGPTTPRKSGEGPNRSCHGGCPRRLDGRGAAPGQALPTTPVPGAGGGPAPRRRRPRRNRTCPARGAASTHGVGPSTSLDRTSDGGGLPPESLGLVNLVQRYATLQAG